MRTLKFRIWDKGENKMIESGGTPSMLALFFKQTAVLNTRDGSEYQQFTGLLDKSGKEIYEGDIAQEMYESGQHSMTSPSVVTWEGSGFVFKTENAICREPELCEVIGNLYENPELLK